jgi:hypothetical protein
MKIQFIDPRLFLMTNKIWKLNQLVIKHVE